MKKKIGYSQCPATLKRGTQIAYIPMHANGDINHPDVEFGFVTTFEPDKGFAFCRYWRKGEPGVLRTLANSECTPSGMLIEHQSVTQKLVDTLIKELC
jgi:hypothetical protein